MVPIHDQEHLATNVVKGRQKCELFLLFNGQGMRYILEQGLCMVSTWNPNFNFICGLLYKEKSRGRNFPPFVFPGFSYLLLPELCLLWTLPKPLLFKFVIVRKSPPHQGAAEADAADRKCFFHCSHVCAEQGLWGNIGIIFPNHFAVWIWFLWAPLLALLSQIPTTHSAVNSLCQKRVILFSSPVSDPPGCLTSIPCFGGRSSLF